MSCLSHLIKVVVPTQVLLAMLDAIREEIRRRIATSARKVTYSKYSHLFSLPGKILGEQG